MRPLTARWLGLTVVTAFAWLAAGELFGRRHDLVGAGLLVVGWVSAELARRVA